MKHENKKLLQFDPSIFPKEPEFITKKECFLKKIKKEARNK